MFGVAIEQEVGRIWTVPATERRIAAAIYSWERLELLLHKTKGNLHRQGFVRFRVPPPKVMLPLLENATMEDNDDLHSLWAQLLATSLDAAADEVHRKFVTILT
jgi:Abortive infection alpha